MEYIIIGLVAIIFIACAVTPILLATMSKEDLEAAGIVCNAYDKQ